MNRITPERWPSPAPPPTDWLFARVMLVDDHALFAQALADLLVHERLACDVVRAGSAEVAAEYLQQVGDIDLVLLDLTLQGEAGYDLLPRLGAGAGAPPMVVISSSEDAATTRTARAAGARGFLAKSAGRGALVRMLRAVHSGQDCFPAVDAPVESPLTPRQRDVLLLLAQGFPNKRICQCLSLTEHTVKTHLKALFTQLGVHNRTECVTRARSLGWL